MFEQEIICRDTCAAIQLLLLSQAAAAAARCVSGAALLAEDAFFLGVSEVLGMAAEPLLLGLG